MPKLIEQVRSAIRTRHYSYRENMSELSKMRVIGVGAAAFAVHLVKERNQL